MDGIEYITSLCGDSDKEYYKKIETIYTSDGKTVIEYEGDKVIKKIFFKCEGFFSSKYVERKEKEE